jgi:exosome complex RNA-binding protein Rrp4
LRYNKHEVILFHVSDKKHEEELVYSNRPHRFVDLETGEVIKLKPQEVRREYARVMHEMVNDLKLKCGQYHIDIIEADINDDFRHVLQSYLIKRGRLK